MKFKINRGLDEGRDQVRATMPKVLFVRLLIGLWTTGASLNCEDNTFFRSSESERACYFLNRLSFFLRVIAEVDKIDKS